MSQPVAAAAIDRRAFVADLLGQCPQALVVTGLGSPSYDVFAAGDRPENFYLWGAMGGAALSASDSRWRSPSAAWSSSPATASS